MSRPKTTEGIGPWLLIAVAGYLIVSTMDAQDAEREFQHYCRMVELHDQTNGEQGWPDYDNKRAECARENP